MASGLRSNKSNKMAIGEEFKIYFENLIKPLVTNINLQESLQIFKDEIVSKFEEKIAEQDKKITQLESNLALKQKTIDVLLSNLEKKADENEQYSRRSCLRINGIEWEEGKVEDINEVLKPCFDKINIPFDPTSIDRAHRIGKSYVDVSGKTMKSVIVKFCSWGPRTRFYKSRPKLFHRGIKTRVVCLLQCH